MTVRMDIRLRRTSSQERLAANARPNWKAQGEFPGGRKILYTLAVQRQPARKRQQREQTTQAVQAAVATGVGQAAGANLGGGGGAGQFHNQPNVKLQ